MLSLFHISYSLAARKLIVWAFGSHLVMSWTFKEQSCPPERNCIKIGKLPETNYVSYFYTGKVTTLNPKDFYNTDTYLGAAHK